jgi:hypothetical protein
MRVCTIFIGPDFYTGRFCLLLFKIDNVKQKKQKQLLGTPDLQLIFKQLLFKVGF